MSLWFIRKESDGKTFRYSFPFDPFIFFFIVGVSVFLLLRLLKTVAVWLS